MRNSLILPVTALVIAAAVWLYRISRALVTLKRISRLKPPVAPPQSGLVSIIIPAKNEERNIESCVKLLLAQDYPKIEIIVANNDSTDHTGEILESIAESEKNSSRFRFVTTGPTPEGWTGKNFAIHAALQSTRGEWFLFTDADTRHEPSSISAALTHCVASGNTFLTLFPRCLTGSFFENLIQPLAMAFIGLWFPIEKINDPQSSVYFGNGQYLFMRRDLYEKLGGHLQVKGEFLEDFALMKAAKLSGAQVECALGTDIFGTRMYDSLDGIWKGWRRIYLHAFGKNAFVLLLKALSVFAFSILPFVFFLSALIQLSAGNTSAVSIAIGWGILCMLVWITAWKSYRIVKGQGRYAFFQPFAAFFIGLVLLDACWVAGTNRKTVWR